MTDRGVTAAQLRAAAPNGDPAIIEAMARDSARVFDKYGLINLNRVWGFLSTIVEESGLKPVAENLNYSAERLVEMNRIAWPGKFPTLAVAQQYAHNPQKLANYVYGGREGNTKPDDGWFYRGRGGTQTTFYNGYLSVERVTGLPLTKNPDLVLAPEHFLECAVAIFVGYPNIRRYCDAQNWEAVWKLVGSGRPNGRLVNPQNHYAALARVKAAIPALVEVPDAPAPATAPPPAPPVIAPAPKASPPPAPPVGWFAALLARIFHRRAAA